MNIRRATVGIPVVLAAALVFAFLSREQVDVQSVTAERPSASPVAERTPVQTPSPAGGLERKSATLPSERTAVQVRGRLVGCAHPWTGVSVELRSKGSVLEASVVGTGEFSFRNVVPAHYRVALLGVEGHRFGPDMLDLSSETSGEISLAVYTFPYTSLRVRFEQEGEEAESIELPCPDDLPRQQLAAVVRASLRQGPGRIRRDRLGDIRSSMSVFDPETGRLEAFYHFPILVEAFAGPTPICEVLVAEQQDEVVIDISGYPPAGSCGAIEGVLRDRTTDAPIEAPHAVALLADAEDRVFLTHPTDSSGAFRIDEVPAGDHVLAVRLDDYVGVALEVQVQPGAVASVPPLFLEPNTMVAGQVVDQDGRLLHERDLAIRVGVSEERVGYHPRPSIKYQRGNGKFYIAYLPQDRVWLYATHPELTCAPLILDLGPAPLRGVRLVLQEGVPVTCRWPDGGVDAWSVRCSPFRSPEVVHRYSKEQPTIALSPGPHELSWTWRGEPVVVTVEIGDLPTEFRLTGRGLVVVEE